MNMIKSAHLKAIVNNRWYIQGFNSCLNFVFHGPYTGLVGLHSTLGYGYEETLFVFKKDYLEYDYVEQDLEKVGKQFLEKFNQNFTYFCEIVKKDEALVKKSLKTRDKASRLKIKSLSTEELVKQYHILSDAYQEMPSVSHIIEAISYIAEPLVRHRLEKITGLNRKDRKFQEIFTSLMQPERPSFINVEQLDLYKIVQHINNDKKSSELFKKSEDEIEKNLSKKLRKLISNHRKKYFYNQINYYSSRGLTDLDYISEIKKCIKKIPDLDKKIKDEKQQYKNNNRRRHELIGKFNIDTETRNIITLIVNVLHWQDDRKKYMLGFVYYLGRMLREIGERYNIPYEMLKRYAPRELTQDKLENFDKKDAQARIKAYIVYMKRINGKLEMEVFTGKECEEFMRYYNKKTQTERDIHGTIASVGKASGLVRVCKTKKDIERFKQGEVLVASMTRPEFVPALKKAVAVITDEGGITCHAAIVSRELGIPCIIGTKTATKVLKNGKLVDVDANHGIIRIVK